MPVFTGMTDVACSEHEIAAHRLRKISARADSGQTPRYSIQFSDNDNKQKYR
jgi:hypothetical protein